jgi:hypothetical protein
MKVPRHGTVRATAGTSAGIRTGLRATAKGTKMTATDRNACPECIYTYCDPPPFTAQSHSKPSDFTVKKVKREAVPVTGRGDL